MEPKTKAQSDLVNLLLKKQYRLVEQDFIDNCHGWYRRLMEGLVQGLSGEINVQMFGGGRISFMAEVVYNDRQIWASYDSSTSRKSMTLEEFERDVAALLSGRIQDRVEELRKQRENEESVNSLT